MNTNQRTDEFNIVGKLASRYSSKPTIRSLMQLIPFWGVADTLLQHRADEIRIDRIRTFFDELANGTQDLNETQIQSEDFLHCFFCTLRAAQNTRQRDKIRLLARLLNSALTPELDFSTDEYEELLAILDSITLREFGVLCDLRKFEISTSQPGEESDLHRANRHWKKFRIDTIQKYGIQGGEFNAFMAKLERTGLYLRITGGFFDYEGDVGMTTPLLMRLLEFVKIRNTPNIVSE